MRDVRKQILAVGSYICWKEVPGGVRGRRGNMEENGGRVKAEKVHGVQF